MNDTLQTIIRSGLKCGGGYLVAKGFATDSTLEVVIAGVMAGVGIIWGILHRTPASPASK